MKGPHYSKEFDTHLGLYRWRVDHGTWLLADPPAGTRASDLRVVALGAGTGLPVVLRALKAALFPSGPAWAKTVDPHRLTAIVTVADDGGSSGRLRREHGVPAPGDVRNCLLALADADPWLTRLFDFRFDGNGETSGHSLGNLILTALSKLGSDFGEAVEQSGRILMIRGQVFPSTLEDVSLRAEFVDGSTVEGESNIPLANRPIERVHLQPPEVRALPQALSALEAADLIVIGPGSLYTSLIPVLLVKEIADGIAHSHARIVLVANLMTEPGETDGYTAADHLAAIRRHAPQARIHDVLLNEEPIPKELVERYTLEGAFPVPLSTEEIEAAGSRPIRHSLLAGGSKIRHDPHKLARALLDLGPLRREVPDA